MIFVGASDNIGEEYKLFKDCDHDSSRSTVRRGVKLDTVVIEMKAEFVGHVPTSHVNAWRNILNMDIIRKYN